MSNSRESASYKKFVFWFNIIIAVFAAIIIASSIVGYNEMDRALLYLVLGVLVLASSVYQIYNSRKTVSN